MALRFSSAPFENAVATLAMLAMVVLPIVEIAARRLFGVGVPASGPIVQHLTLWVGFLGAAIAARDGKLLALATGALITHATWRRLAGIVAAAVAACVSLILAWGGVEMMRAEREAQTTIGADIPTWVAQAVLPGAFAAIAARLVWKAGAGWRDRLAAAAGLLLAVALIQGQSGERLPWLGVGLAEGVSAWPGLVVIAVAAVMGMPLFAILGGAAAWLFLLRRRDPGGDSHRNLFAHRLADAGRHPAVHAGRLSPRRRARVRAAAPRVPRAGRLDSRRNRRRLRRAVLLLHGVHRRVGGDDSRARRRAVSRASTGRLSGPVRAGTPDRLRIARAAVAASAAAHPLRRGRADSDRGHFHRRHPPRASC